jgi:archaellin
MFFFLGTIMVIAFVLGAAYSIAKKMNKGAFVDPKKAMRERETFKQNAQQVKVDLRACKVVSTSHTETVLKSGSWQVQALDILYGDDSANQEQVNVSKSQIVFRITEGNVNYDYVSPVIFMDKTTLLFKLDMQDSTVLYIDRKDRAKYYFDLEFLVPKEI